MGWLARLRRSKRETRRLGDENLLVISDIHIGEDILSEGPEHLGGHIRALNRGLASFVSHHREHLVDERLWHLVINGDMFDFVKVSVRPSPEEAFAEWRRNPTAQEEIGGVPNTPQSVVWKLSRILEIHRPLFRELALFLLEGHRITIIEGNHDAEFYFPEVRDALRTELVRLAEREAKRRGESFDGDEVGGRLEFRVWFLARAGRYHIEHGHQYDEYCSFEYNLAPYDRPGAETLATPLSHRPMPYFAEVLGDFSTHGMDELGLTGMLRRVAALGPRILWIVLRRYFVVALTLLGRAGRKRRRELVELAGSHEAELDALASESPYGRETLEKLDHLKATPAEYSVVKMIHTFYLDRVLVGVPAFAIAGLGVWHGDWSGFGLALGVLLGALVTLRAIRRAFHSDLPAELRRVAADIASLTGVRYIVFGHSHKPELVNLRERFGFNIGPFGERAFYANSGSWVTREILRGAEGHGMTYVELTMAGAALKRWHDGGDGPKLLAASHPQVVDRDAQSS